MERDAVANTFAIDDGVLNRPDERRVRTDGDGIFARQLDAERNAVIPKILNRLERRDAD